MAQCSHGERSICCRSWLLCRNTQRRAKVDSMCGPQRETKETKGQKQGAWFTYEPRTVFLTNMSSSMFLFVSMCETVSVVCFLIKRSENSSRQQLCQSCELIYFSMVLTNQGTCKTNKGIVCFWFLEEQFWKIQ